VMSSSWKAGRFPQISSMRSRTTFEELYKLSMMTTS
jgi:hypothetical protein